MTKTPAQNTHRLILFGGSIVPLCGFLFEELTMLGLGCRGEFNLNSWKAFLQA